MRVPKTECQTVPFLDMYFHCQYFSSSKGAFAPKLQEETVWGIAYKIGPEDQERVMAHLDHREKDGYQRTPVTFHPQDPSIQPWQLTMYLGTESNPFFVGHNEKGEESIAQIIASAEGPSGSNKDYLFQLANTMRTLGVSDSHLFNIESRVRKILEV